MRIETVNNINWPVAENGDFDTTDEGKTFFVTEDENGDRYYAYGHVPEADMKAEVTRYLQHMIPSGDYEICGWFKQLHAKFTNHHAEQFSWDGVTEETPHAFPLTVMKL